AAEIATASMEKKMPDVSSANNKSPIPEAKKDDVTGHNVIDLDSDAKEASVDESPATSTAKRLKNNKGKAVTVDSTPSKAGVKENKAEGLMTGIYMMFLVVI
ncbi:hypothetical protein A2U01_0010297, partial [Trifolium medium]|nr:hypothetical protein [Trifolium medium]